MNYCIDPNSDEPIMLIDRHIGFDIEEGMGVDGAEFAKELLLLDTLGKKRIQVWINSPGGVVMDGYNIYNAILKSNTKVDTYCIGIAASIAAVIFEAGRNRCMQDFGVLMFHDVHGGENSEQLNKIGDSVAVMISARTGKTVEEVKAIMQKTTWLSASEAFEIGFCDKIEASSYQNQKRGVASDTRAMWKQGAAVLNSILKLNNNKMTKVTNKLGLNPDAIEDSIVASIEDLQNKAKNADKIKAEIEAKQKAFDEEMDALKAELEACKNKLAEVENSAKVEAEKALDTQIKNSLEGFVKVGRITNESIAEWTETAKTIGFEKVENMIKNLPLNKVANKLPELLEVEIPTSAMSKMAELQNKLKNNKK